MNCRKCGANGARIVDSRQVQEGRETKRRRACRVCGYRWNTLEIPAALVARLTRKPSHTA
jgi:transcriptional repressor NrdR